MRMQKRLGLFCIGATALVLAASCADTPHPDVSSERVGQTASALTSDGGAGTPARPTINSFVVYAAQNVTLGSGDHSLGGDIGVATTAGSSPQLTVGGQDQLDINHTLFAPAISVGNLAIVGAVDTSSLTNSGGHVGAQNGYPDSMPPLPAFFSAMPGTQNITVAAGQQQTLSPGSFGSLTDNGIVFLNPGTYSFSSVTLGSNAQLQALQGGSTSVLIAGTLSTGTFAQIFPVAQPANELTISVSGADGSGSQPTAVALGANTQIVSLLAASSGSLSFGNNVQATGAFAGANFTAGSNVILNFQSGFPVQTPTISTFVAYAELSLTLGTGVQSLGGDFGVAAVGAPGVGAQLIVGNQDNLDPQHTLYAPSVSLGSTSLVGDVAANTLQTSRGRWGTNVPYPTSMPSLLLPPAGVPGTQSVQVGQGQNQTLNPGSYGTLADNGTVFLNPGSYSFANIALGNNAQLVAQPGGSTTILVTGTLSTGSFAHLFPLGQPAGCLAISVAGDDGPSGSPPAAAIGANAQITALLNVPRATLSLGNDVQATGAFAGFSMSVGNGATLNFQTGFSPSAPGQQGQQQLSGYLQCAHRKRARRRSPSAFDRAQSRDRTSCAGSRGSRHGLSANLRPHQHLVSPISHGVDV